MQTQLRKRPLSRPRAGFSLIEIVVAVTILAVLAGAAIPVTTKVLTYQARKATRAELQVLSDAASEYFRDTWVVPTDLTGLLVDDDTSGWSGPYLPGVVTDQITGLTGYQVDAWSRPYSVSVSGDRVTITSMGEDAQAGSDTDLEITLDVTVVRRGETLERLRTINQAVLNYNANVPDTSDPLPADWPTARAMIVSKGLLPNSNDYLVDGWGVTFVEDPPGMTPVVRVTSQAVGAASTGASGSTESGGSRSGSEPGNSGFGHSQGDGHGKGNRRRRLPPIRAGRAR